jgi:tRNA(Ile)-lysidine synthase
MIGLAAEVRNKLVQGGGFLPGQVVLVAVSGGLDSMVLLHLLSELAREQGWRLAVAHFNHGLRGEEGDADETFVGNEARRLGLESLVGRGDVRHQAAQEGSSIEMCARRLRHEFLARSALARGGRDVVLAHHADDQVETLLLRLARGSGEGLGGMAPLALSPANPQVRLWRPLLRVEKAELSACARALGLAYREDSTNRSPEAWRNRLRLEMVPWLRRHLQPQLPRVVGRTMEVLRDQADCLERLAEAWLARPEAPFEALHVAVQRAVLLRQLHRLGVEVTFDLVEDLRRRANTAVTAAGGRRWRRRADGGIEEVAGSDGEAPAPLVLDLGTGTGTARYAGLSLTWSIVTAPAGGLPNPRPAPGRERLDAEVVGNRVRLRVWQPGDRYRPLGLGHRVKLQDAFTNQKVPRAERQRRVLLSREDGTILWVEGLRLAEEGRLTARSRRVLEWGWERQDR